MSDDEPQTSTAEASPWILPVYVCSLEKDDSNLFVQKEAMCTIDTGNLQGNLVSRDFALKLGYTADQFEPLKDWEKNGGRSASGHTVIPEGVIHLTWYHRNSTRTFRKMRFLVSQSQHCDLVIGARSIQKHKLLCAPNLTQGPGIVLPKHRPDNNFIALNRIKARLENELATCKQQALKAAKEDELNGLNQEISQLEKELKVAKLKVERYDAKMTLSNDQSNQKLIVIVATIERDLKEAEAKLKPKEDATPLKSIPSQPVPPIMVRRASTNPISNIIRRNTRPKDKTQA